MAVTVVMAATAGMVEVTAITGTMGMATATTGMVTTGMVTTGMAITSMFITAAGSGPPTAPSISATVIDLRTMKLARARVRASFLDTTMINYTEEYSGNEQCCRKANTTRAEALSEY
jgi:hypothetical protein